jgi:proline iminopeptidase
MNGQSIYSKAFGNPKNPAAIYLHGGPGYNSANFEVTTAQNLSNNGYYVIVYDRRGEGRSYDKNAKYNFEETFVDLNELYKKFNIQKAVLIGHSFGGMVATLFAEKYPEKITAIAYVGAPINLQKSFKHIIAKSKEIYSTKKDTTNLYYINKLSEMDSSSLEYSSYSFLHAMQNGFYTPKNLNPEAKELYKLFKTDSTLMKYARKMEIEAPKGFWENDHYTTLNMAETIKTLKANGMKIGGYYGREDGLYSPDQVYELQEIIGSNYMMYLDNCSHNFFIDQQTSFIKGMQSLIFKEK